MPVTWCYDVMDEDKKYCSTGFPVGCHVTEQGQPRDACVTKVCTLFIIFFFTKYFVAKKENHSL